MIPIDTPLIDELIDRLSAVIIDHHDELTALDRAIGDGDHGINLKRGFEAIQAARVEITAKTPDEGIQAAGIQLVMKVGGASGPLYGTLLMSLGKALGPGPHDRQMLVMAVVSAVDAVKARGKSTTGQKTMLDVLVPVAQAVSRGESLAGLRQVAQDSLEHTRGMLATRGRASFLGERSVGHLDPGARSSQLLIDTLCEVLEHRHAA